MYDRMNRLIAALTTGLHERDEPVRLGLLAAMAGESIFLLGPPGVGKSLIARRLQMVFTDAKSFSYLMGRFSTPDEVFGPLSIKRLKQDDRYERVTTNYLPDADVVFLDEIWKASAPIRNALLTALNERLFRNGSVEMELPLKVFIGASNELPEDDDTAAAFWDRFLIRLVLGPVEDSNEFRELVNDTRDVYADVVPREDKISRQEYLDFQDQLAAVAVPDAVAVLMLGIRDRLRSASGETGGEAGEDPGGEAVAGRYVSDRRWKKIVRLLRASALLHGRDRVEPLDCAVIRHCIWDSASDREAADTIVTEALSEYAARPELARDLAGRLESLRDRFLAASVEVFDEQSVQPVVYRDEYYRLLIPGDRNDKTRKKGTPEESGEMVLIWHGDVDELAGDVSEEVDLFQYGPDSQLLGSRTASVRRVGPWLLELDGAEHEIETEQRSATTTRSRDLDPRERGALLGEAEALVTEIQSAADHLLAERAALDNRARAHLFVARAATEIVTGAIESAAENLIRLRLEAEQLESRLREDT